MHSHVKGFALISPISLMRSATSENFAMLFLHPPHLRGMFRSISDNWPGGCAVGHFMTSQSIVLF